MNRVASISVQIAFGSHSCASTVNATVEGWSSGNTVCFTSMLYPEVLNAKLGNSIYHFEAPGMARPGIEPRPVAYKASILRLAGDAAKRYCNGRIEKMHNYVAYKRPIGFTLLNASRYYHICWPCVGMTILLWPAE